MALVQSINRCFSYLHFLEILAHIWAIHYELLNARYRFQPLNHLKDEANSWFYLTAPVNYVQKYAIVKIQQCNAACVYDYSHVNNHVCMIPYNLYSEAWMTLWELNYIEHEDLYKYKLVWSVFKGCCSYCSIKFHS